MSKSITKRVMDITGIELMPGEPTVCLDNGEQGFECCCDECDYYLLCFPEFNPKKQRSIIIKTQLTITRCFFNEAQGLGGARLSII